MLIKKVAAKKAHGVQVSPNTPGKKTITKVAGNSEMPLNKYMAHCGVTSRRDAVEIIKGGQG